MTWLVSYPLNDVPQYAEHATEQQAEAHATEPLRSKRAHYAVVFWASEGAA